METLLYTKIYPPPITPNLIARPRLALDLEKLPPLTLLSAPAGSGKTTLIREWRARSQTSLAWLSVDEEDNDPHRFISYLIAALQTIKSEIGAGALLLSQSAPAIPIQAIIAPLLNDLNKLPSALVLVLDDYHQIHTAAVHGILAYILNHQPAPLRLIISTRRDPPFLIARLRGQGLLKEIRMDDLRFTNHEAAAFLQRLDLGLSDEDAALLNFHIEGWISGLLMAALTMTGKADLHRLVASLSGNHPFFSAYLTEEVFSHQPQPVKDFLVQTSILDRFCAELCEAVTQSQSSREVLNTLSDANAFIVPLDDQPKWFRFHQLFSEFLRSQLSADQVGPLNLRACRWFEEHELYPEAIKHALQARDFGTAAHLIEKHAPAAIAQGKPAGLLSWIQMLPDAVLYRYPRVLTYTALAKFLLADLTGLDQAFIQAEAALKNLPPGETSPLWAELEAARLSVSIERGARLDDIEAALRLREKIPVENIFLRASLAIGLGDAYRAKGDFRSALQSFIEAKETAQRGNHLLANLVAGYEIAELYFEQGQLRKAGSVHREIIQAVEKLAGPDTPLPALGGAYVGLGKICYEQGDLQQAEQYIEKGIHLSEQPGGIGMARHGYLALAFVKQALGKEKEAWEHLKQAEAMARQSPRRDAQQRLEPEKVRFWLLQNRQRAAIRWAGQIETQAGLSAEAQVALARVALAQDESSLIREAQLRLAALRPEIERRELNLLLLQVLLLQALIFHRQGEREKALSTLDECFNLSEPETFTRRFVEEGKPMLELLGLASQQGLAPEYVRALISAFRQEDRQAQPLVEPLSQRELEVLALLSVGATNAEIAGKLFIAVGTVKRHVLSIYQKLGVNSRTAAVARARELNLL